MLLSRRSLSQVCHRHARRARRTAPDMTADEWLTVLLRSGFRCAYCDRFSPSLTVDHLVPLSRGGANAAFNVAPACVACQRAKGCRDVHGMLPPDRLAALHARLHPKDEPPDMRVLPGLVMAIAHARAQGERDLELLLWHDLDRALKAVFGPTTQLGVVLLRVINQASGLLSFPPLPRGYVEAAA